MAFSSYLFDQIIYRQRHFKLKELLKLFSYSIKTDNLFTASQVMMSTLVICHLATEMVTDEDMGSKNIHRSKKYLKPRALFPRNFKNKNVHEV